MIGTDDRAFGADDVAGTLYAGEGLRKLRFPMTDNTPRKAANKATRKTAIAPTANGKPAQQPPVPISAT